MTHAIEVASDLRRDLGTARDQGPRPTCLAFAASDLHAALRDGWTELSCEYLFYQAQRRAARPPSVGATLPHLLGALGQDGQPAETAWPYAPTTPSDLAAWRPPTSVGAVYARDGEAREPDWRDVIDQLDRGRPVLLLLTLSRSFFGPCPQGVIIPANDEVGDPALRHAVVAVGHGRVDDEPAILIRNSWGPSWGDAGHAWAPAAFIADRLFGMALLQEDVDVSRYRSAA